LKPKNVLLAQGRLDKITDFGLAKIGQEAGLETVDAESETGERQRLQGGGGIVGTLSHMALKQWRASALDSRAR